MAKICLQGIVIWIFLFYSITPGHAQNDGRCDFFERMLVNREVNHPLPVERKIVDEFNKYYPNSKEIFVNEDFSKRNELYHILNEDISSCLASKYHQLSGWMWSSGDVCNVLSGETFFNLLEVYYRDEISKKRESKRLIAQKKELEQQKAREEKMKAYQEEKARLAQEKKKYRQQVCQQMMADLGLSSEEFQYMTPFAYNLGEYICLGKMGQNLVKFSKPGFFDKTYTAIYEFPGGKELTLKFKHDDNLLFQQEAKKNLKTDDTVLNIEILIDGETLKPKAFMEAMMTLMQVTSPIVSIAATRYPDFRELDF